MTSASNKDPKGLIYSYYCRKEKIGAERCECVFDTQTSKASKELKAVLLHLWRVNVKTTGGFIYISLEDFHMDKS